MQPAEIVVKTENNLPKVSPKKEKQDSPSKHYTKGKGNGKINVDNVHLGKEPELTRRRSVRHSRKVFVDSILEYEVSEINFSQSYDFASAKVYNYISVANFKHTEESIRGYSDVQTGLFEVILTHNFVFKGCFQVLVLEKPAKCV